MYLRGNDLGHNLSQINTATPSSTHNFLGIELNFLGLLTYLASQVVLLPFSSFFLFKLLMLRV